MSPYSEAYADCPRCGKPVLKSEAHVLRWFEYLFYTCSRACHDVWTSTCLGRKNITEAECR